MVVVEIGEADPYLDTRVLGQVGKEFTPNHFAKGVENYVEVGVLILTGEGLTEPRISEHSAAACLVEFDALRSLGASYLPALCPRM